MISQQQAKSVICKAAKVYDKSLNNRDLLIITGNQNSNNFSLLLGNTIQTTAKNGNFLHLTGVETNNISAELFF